MPDFHAMVGAARKNKRDARHGKTDLEVFVVVIPKEGLAGWGPANPSLGVTPTIKYYSAAFSEAVRWVEKCSAG